MTLTELSLMQHPALRESMPLTRGKLIEQSFLSATAALYLDSAVRARQTILVSGLPGSGKTTLLNVLGASLGYSTDRVIVVERDFRRNFGSLLADAPSLRTSTLRSHQVETLLHQVRHHRPDRVAVDDLAEQFAWEVRESIVSRFRGSVVSIEASGTIEALRRFAELAGPRARILAGMLAESIRVVVQFERAGAIPECRTNRYLSGRVRSSLFPSPL